MTHTLRVGIQIAAADPFWVQVREIMWQRASALALELVEITIQGAYQLSPDQQAEVLEDLLAHELDVLICNTYTQEMLTRILDRDLPLIYIAEIAFSHPRLTSDAGYYAHAHVLGTFLHQRMGGRGTLLIVGGQAGGEDKGQSRIDGFLAALPGDSLYSIYHVASDWLHELARPSISEFLRAHPGLHIDAIYGLSDSLALAARDLCQASGHGDAHTLVFGINGDPLALAAIADGSMAATIELDIEDSATQVIELAYRIAQGQPQPEHFRYSYGLVTTSNVADVAMRKLISLARLPSHLLDLNRQHEHQRAVQLETSLAIDRQVGMILDEQQLSLAIIALIRDHYGFDHARFLIWQPETAQLMAVGGAQPGCACQPAGPLAYALEQNQAVVIPNTHASRRFAHDPLWPQMRARVVVPVHLGGQIVGLLDLHQHRTAHYSHEEIDGLQMLADRIGISMRNAELYGQELNARAQAEKADQFKTALLANVSHELRTPLNVILGYSRSVLERLREPAPHGGLLAEDVGQIQRSGEHLLRLINDLLDLSRAEIDELQLLIETLDTSAFLQDVFQSSAATFGTERGVAWRLDLPPTLPPIEADPVRLRQILLNLLHNAHKFTDQGQITLGAELVPPHLHLWVSDTGSGIAAELQEHIFEPFVSAGRGGGRHEGIGLGLSITRRLVTLHHGWMNLESRPDDGSTFHIFLPLPPPTLAPLQVEHQPTLLLISDTEHPPASIAHMATRRGLRLRQLHPGGDLPSTLEQTQPLLMAWDLSSASAGGWAVAEQLRQHPQLAQLPMILYHGDAEDQPDPGGSTGLLMKPLGDDALIETIKDLTLAQTEGSILVVDDDAHTRALHSRLIAEQFPNFTIHELEDGRAALELLEREPPRLVVLDLMMPDVDGFAVLAALRASPRNANVPVLVLSGQTLSANDIRRLSAARVVFQTKELLSEPELAESLRRTLAREDTLPPYTSALVKQAIAFIQQHHDEPLARQAIAAAVGVSKDYLGRIFHQELGLSPWEYLIRYRVLRAKELLRTSDYSISEIATRVGFDSPTYFSHIFHREVGCSPRAYRAR